MTKRLKIIILAFVVTITLVLSVCIVDTFRSKAMKENKGENKEMVMKIDGTKVDVTWEESASVEELEELAASGLSISMSMYGGFEQVGSIGKSITQNDKQMTTGAGDIVLYSGNQLVVFYGSNSWAYTKLGKINMSQKELADLLGKGDVTITISME